jgi:hypothetical protein
VIAFTEALGAILTEGLGVGKNDTTGVGDGETVGDGVGVGVKEGEGVGAGVETEALGWGVFTTTLPEDLKPATTPVVHRALKRNRVTRATFRTPETLGRYLYNR